MTLFIAPRESPAASSGDERGSKKNRSHAAKASGDGARSRLFEQHSRPASPSEAWRSWDTPRSGRGGGFIKRALAEPWFIPVVCGAVALIFSWGILDAQWHGEDELNVFTTGRDILVATNGDWVTVVRHLGGAYHPPGRYLQAAAAFALGGVSVPAFRLPSLVIWVSAVMLGARTAQQLAGRVAGLIAGLLLGASGLFNLEAMAFGHGVVTLCGMYILWYKVRHPRWQLDTTAQRRQYLVGGLVLAISFVWFTSLVPIVGMYHLLYAYHATSGLRNKAALKRYLLLTLPFVVFYIAYYAVFLGIPYYRYREGLTAAPGGQLSQNFNRAGSAYLNVTSWLANLKILNWYHLPFISWLLLGIGTVWMWRSRRDLWLLLVPYAVLFSFYLFDNTAQHFLSFYIWTIPLAVAATMRFFETQAPYVRAAGHMLLALLVLATAGFGYTVHVQTYDEVTYPRHVEQRLWALAKWPNNMVRPLPAIAQDLAGLLGPDDQYSVTIDGALPQYYFPDPRYIETKPQVAAKGSTPCTELVATDVPLRRLRAVVTSNKHVPLCLKTDRVIRYAQSPLEVHVFPDSTQKTQPR